MLLEQVEQVEEGLLRATDGVLQLPEGGTIRTFPPPASGFDPLQASDEELLAHGFPGRPAEERLLGPWQQVLRCKRIEPIFRRLESPGPDRPEGVKTSGSSSRLSGLVTPPGGNLMKDVQARWLVPSVYPPYAAVDGIWYSASSWIGFSGDLEFKCGVQCRVVSTFGTLARQFFPFWEWELWGLFQVVSLSVSPGDQVSCAISLDKSFTSATVYLSNVTAGTGVSFTVSPGRGPLPTLQCRWAVEALKINSPDVALARFGTVYFDGANSINSLGTPFAAGSGSVTDMFASGRQVAHAGIANPYLVWTQFGPSHF